MLRVRSYHLSYPWSGSEKDLILQHHRINYYLKEKHYHQYQNMHPKLTQTHLLQAMNTYLKNSLGAFHSLSFHLANIPT